jgi:hypothetical protein
MPLYAFRCECGFSDEYFLQMSKRNTVVLLCEQCGRTMQRVVGLPMLGKPAYQMQAVLSDGRHIPGHFGKMAKKR